MQPSVGMSYGQLLPDQVERISSVFDAHLGVINDVRELYQGRVALEREYAAKLQLLSKKAAEKKSRIEATLAVGEHPTKVLEASALAQNSVLAAYTALVDSMINTAQDHVNVADGLTTQVVEVLRVIEKKNEDAKKTEMQFFQKLLSDRDRVYAERLKCKQKYDEECNEVDLSRQKQARAQDDKHADRAAKQSEHQRNEMLNSKNAYLISIAVANNAKGQFYDTNLPALENQFQLLQRRLVERFSKILQHSQSLQLSHLETVKGRISQVDAAFGEVDPVKDQDIFIDHNIRPFTAPDDWTFEPCSTHYDTSDISIEQAPKTFLQNKQSRCRSKLEELSPLIDSNRRDQDRLLKQISSYKADHTIGDIDEVSANLQEVQHQLAFYTASETILRTELDTIYSALGDDEGAQKPHSFKSSSFSIPTQCGYCKTTIWGLSKQGKSCKLCGISVHSKCELKVPADCQQASVVRSSSTSRPGSTMSRSGSRVSTTQAPTASSFVPSFTPESNEESYPVARVLFDFTPTSEFELEVSEGATVHVLEADDGSGWVKVADMGGKDGLVPATYLAHEGSTDSESRPQGPTCQHVRVIYDYEAQGHDELPLIEGQTIELTSGPVGGQNYGNGWWEGVNSAGRRGIFPSNYVELF